MSHHQEQVREWAWLTGALDKFREWLNSPYDTWERNPHYTGKPGPHPEDYPDDEAPVRDTRPGRGADPVWNENCECPACGFDPGDCPF